VVCDVGTDQLAKVTLLKWPHNILDSKNEALQDKGQDAIAGPLCFAGDILLHHTDASNIKTGDPLFVTHAGAYTHALSNSFNGRCAPAWVVLDNENITKASNAQGKYDHQCFTNHLWNSDRPEINHQEPLPQDIIHALNSEYLYETSAMDKFEYEEFNKIGKNEFQIKVITSSQVPFISMPFAIRIIGDAGIVAFLYLLGLKGKEMPVWGRKLVMECFGQASSGSELSINLSFGSVARRNDGSATTIVYFKTVCENIKGSLILYTKVKNENKISALDKNYKEEGTRVDYLC
jgi:diaminopimelate decarboxylase